MKKLLESIDQINECPPEMAEGPGMSPAPSNPGNPVTMSVNLNASGADHVQDLINMMKNAGMGDAKPAADAMMPMRMDMERLAAMMDEPGMEDPNEELEPIEDEIDTEEGYDNEPDPEYQDHEYMTKDLSGGLNREKKAYAKAQDGDNAMAVEEIKAKLMAALAEKQKGGDKDDDGDEDFADVQIARMTASGMDKDKAIAKVKNKDYNK